MVSLTGKLLPTALCASAWLYACCGGYVVAFVCLLRACLALLRKLRLKASVSVQPQDKTQTSKSNPFPTPACVCACMRACAYIDSRACACAARVGNALFRPTLSLCLTGVCCSVACLWLSLLVARNAHWQSQGEVPRQDEAPERDKSPYQPSNQSL